MSGPKSGSWRLVPAGSGGGYSFADVQQILQRHLDKIEALQKRLEQLGKVFVPAALDRSLDRATLRDQAWAERAVRELNHRYAVYIALRDTVEQAEAEAAEARAQEEARRRLEAEKARIAAEEARLAAERAARIESATALAASLVRQRAERLAAEEQARAEERATLGRRAIEDAARLLPGVSDQVRAEIEELAVTCLAEMAPDRCLLVVNDLKIRVDRANRDIRARQKLEAERRRADAQRAQAAHARLSELGAPARGKLNDSLYAVIDGERSYDANLKAEVSAAIKAAEKNRATAILKEALDELGYVVGEDFETAFADGGGLFQRPEWGDYYCRLTLDAARERASVFMVRAEGETGVPVDTALAQDRDMETAWCSELPALLDRLDEKNMVLDLHRRMDPGTIPMSVIKKRPAAARQTRSAAEGSHAAIARPIDKP